MIVTLIAAISADGKIAQEAGQSSLDWTSKEDTQFFVSKTKEIGTVVMGKTTWLTFGRALKGRRLIVLCRDPEAQAPVEGVEFVKEGAEELVARLASEGVSGLALCGGATVYSQFLQAELVDELYLTVEPALFGEGIPLFTGGDRINMRFVDSMLLGDASVLLHYQILK